MLDPVVVFEPWCPKIKICKIWKWSRYSLTFFHVVFYCRCHQDLFSVPFLSWPFHFFLRLLGYCRWLNPDVSTSQIDISNEKMLCLFWVQCFQNLIEQWQIRQGINAVSVFRGWQRSDLILKFLTIYQQSTPVSRVNQWILSIKKTIFEDLRS